MRNQVFLLALLWLALASSSACGGGKASSTTTASNTVQTPPSPQLVITTKQTLPGALQAHPYSTMLSASGELSPAAGGPGVFPNIDPEIALQPRHIMGSVAPAYQPSPRPEERNRRTIYAFRTRGLPDKMSFFRSKFKEVFRLCRIPLRQDHCRPELAFITIPAELRGVPIRQVLTVPL